MSLIMGIELFFLLSTGCSLLELRAMDQSKNIDSKRTTKSARGNVQSCVPLKTRKIVDLEVISAINEGNSDALKSRGNFDVNGWNAQEKPLLMCAISARSFAAVRFLLDKKADITVLYERMTVLHSAAVSGDMHIMELLLSREYALDIDAGDRFGNTPLHTAAFTGHEEIVKLLLAHGADIRALNTNGSTPLHLSSASGAVDIGGLLLLNNAAINAEDKYGATPLHRAAEMGKTKVATMLILQGVNINAVDCYGWTPLHFAAVRGHIEIIALLLIKGGCLEAKNVNGQTAINVAKDNIKIILRHLQKKREYVVRPAMSELKLSSVW